MASMDTIYRSSSFDQLVSNLPTIFLKALDQSKPDMVKSLFTQQPWNPAQGDRVTFSGYALPQFAERSDGENSAATSLQVADEATMTVRQAEYKGKFDYTHRMDTFDKEQIAQQFTTAIVSGINRIIDKEMTDKVLTYAENSTYTPRNKNYTVDWTCADGVALAGTHAVTQGATFSTEYTTAGSLSTSTLSAMEQQARTTHVNALGEPIDINMDTLIIPNHNKMIKKAFEIFGTPKDPGTNLNAANIFQTQWNKRIVVLNNALTNNTATSFLTADTNLYRYALVDSRYLNNFQYQLSNAPSIQLKDSQFDTVLKRILGIAYCAFATVRPQGYIIHRQNVSAPDITD